MTLLSRGADYAIRAMLDVACQPEGERTVTERIAERQEIPAAFLSKVVAQLTQAGLMRTHRGAAGGVLLGKPAEQINLRQIVEAVQGPIIVNLCTGPYDGCQRAVSCPASSVLMAAQRGLEEKLERAILAELSSEAARLAEAREGR
ncbi:MAG: Rrf2 family transcriptional regulator [Anaerolineae bacterium]|nr:Rrf2 family transcriptional regulator [Anaerolineae bacterium]NIO00078.1 Rrf2 family transcriptional regulator [Anaerolineae bacterium]NIQ82862.1 Rrf2 family transcriptional regulator [Anaerolineae bacterium]